MTSSVRVGVEDGESISERDVTQGITPGQPDVNEDEDVPPSSSAVRQLMANGDLAVMQRWLAKNYPDADAHIEDAVVEAVVRFLAARSNSEPGSVFVIPRTLSGSLRRLIGDVAEGRQVDHAAQLMSVALVRYADWCPTDLHPDCPYVTESGGTRSCASQCRDEIIRLTKPGHSGGSILAGPLFDARQVFLSERTTVPDAEWHTSSLLQRLQRALLHPPRGAGGSHFLVREIDVTNALAYLGQRGFDMEWIVRFGLAQDLPTRLALWVIDSVAGMEAKELDCPGWLQPWVDVFERNGGGNWAAANIGQLLATAHRSGFIDWIRCWLQQAPLDRIVNWSVSDDVGDDVVPDDGQARWMIDRFTQTYLQDWSETSLHHEYRYLRGVQEGPVPVLEMMRRQLTEAMVAHEIARRAVEGGRSRLAEVVSQAMALLDEGRRREAAALFDAARILDPSDPDAHNNYGFCVTPDDPQGALAALKRSEDLGTSELALNLTNQAVALRLLGKTSEALVMAGRAHDQTGGRTERPWLWRDPSADEPTAASADLLSYICRLGLQLAAETGNRAEVEIWRGRLGDADGVIE